MKKYALYILVFIALIGVPFAVGAQNIEYTPLEPFPGVRQDGEAQFADLVQGFFRLLVNIGAFVAVTVLVIGGITYMVSEKTFSKLVAREKIKAAFFGIAILAGAWLLLNTINPQLLTFDRNLLSPAEDSRPSSSNANNNSANQINTQTQLEFIRACEDQRAENPKCKVKVDPRAPAGMRCEC